MMKTFARLTMVGVCATAAVWCVSSTDNAAAQRRFNDPDVAVAEEDRKGFTANAWANVDATINSARDHIAAAAEEGDAAERTRLLRLAARGLRDILERDDIDQSVTEMETDSRWISAATRIEALIEGVGGEVRAALDESMNVSAQVALDAARRDDDDEALRTVVKRYLFTEPGRAAARAFAERAFEEGVFENAVYGFRRLLESYPKDEWPVLAPIIARLGYCYRMLGRRRSLEILIADTAHLRKRPLLVGDRAVPIGGYLDTQMQACADMTLLPEQRRDAAFPINSLSAMSLAGPPGDPAKPQWSKELPRRETRPYEHRFMNYFEPQVPPFAPALYQSYVLVNSGITLSAYDVFTGAEVWHATPWRPGKDHYHLQEPDPNLLLTVSAARGLAFASLENSLSYTFNDPAPDYIGNSWLFPFFPVVGRSLTAVDVSTGRVQWLLGGKYTLPREMHTAGDVEKVAATANFHTSFLVGDMLYAVATRRENQAEVFLFAIEPSSGKPLWYLSLCQGQQENTMFGRSAREPFPGVPLYAEGKLYLCSNLGGVIAVDLDARRVAWVSRYEAIPRQFSRFETTYYRKPTFANGAPVLARLNDGRRALIVAPTDSLFLTCYNAADGKALWKHAAESPARGGNRYDPEQPTVFIGVKGRYAYYGKRTNERFSHLVQLDIEQGGQPAATIEVRAQVGRNVAHNPLSGKPELTEDAILWPGALGISALPIDVSPLAQRNAYQLWPTPKAAGNLIVRDGMLIQITGVQYLGSVQGARPAVECRFDLDRTLETLKAEIQASPKDPTVLLRYALLAERLQDKGILKDGQIEEFLREALRIASANPAHASILPSIKRGLFDRALARALAARKASNHEAFAAALEEAAASATGPGNLRDIFRLREEGASARADQDVAAQGALRNFYRNYLDAKPIFTLNARHGHELPLPLYARLRYGELSASLKDDAAAVDSYQLLLEATSGAEYADLRRELIRDIEAAKTRSGVGVYAKTEAVAGEVYRNALETGEQREEQLLALAQRYPNSVVALRALSDVITEAAHRSGDVERRLEDALVSLLETRALDAEVAGAWLLLADLHERAGRRVSAYVALSRLRGGDPELPIGAGENLRPLRRVLDERTRRFIGAFEEGELFPRLALPPAPDPVWVHDGGNDMEYITVKPVQGDDELMLIFRASTGAYLAVDAATGEERWRAGSLRGSDVEARRLGDGIIMIDSDSLSLVERETGLERWRVPFGGRREWAGMLGGIALLATKDEREDHTRSVVAVDCERGRVMWRTQVALSGRVTVMSRRDSIYVAGALPQGYALFRLDLGNGAILASATTDASASLTPVIDDAGRLLVMTTRRALEIRDGEDLRVIRAIQAAAEIPHSLFVRGEEAYVLYRSGALAAFKTSDGTSLWSLPPPEGNRPAEGPRSVTMVNRAWLAGETILAVGIRLRGTDQAVWFMTMNVARGQITAIKDIQAGESGTTSSLAGALAFRDGLALSFIPIGRHGNVGSPRIMVIDGRNGDTALDLSLPPYTSGYYPQLALHSRGVAVIYQGKLNFYGSKR